MFVTFENRASPGNGSRRCGHAGPGAVALIVVCGGGLYGFGGAKRLAPAVEAPKGMFRKESTLFEEVPWYVTPVPGTVTMGVARAVRKREHRT